MWHRPGRAVSPFARGLYGETARMTHVRHTLTLMAYSGGVAMVTVKLLWILRVLA